MDTLHQLLSWRLLNGSHKFPGPDGGTCITEAVIVVAGLKYRAISSVNDCPPCFSRPISAYAIRINDEMPDDLRQELLIPFIVRLAGTSDTPEIERQRADLMVIRCVTDVLPIILRLYKLESHAILCELATTRAEAHAAANKSRDALCAVAVAASAARVTWVKAVEILDSAMRIGRQAEPIEIAVIVARAEAAKAR